LYQSYDFLKFFFGSFHPDINYINENGSKIFWLVGHFNESEQINKLQFLLKKGWDPNIKGKDDDNAFTWLDEIFDVDNNDEKIYNTIYKLLSQK